MVAVLGQCYRPAPLIHNDQEQSLLLAEQRIVTHLHIGETTQQEILYRIGVPDTIKEIDRTVVWMYRRYGQVLTEHSTAQSTVISFVPDTVRQTQYQQPELVLKIYFDTQSRVARVLTTRIPPAQE